MNEAVSSGYFVWTGGEAPPRISRKDAMEISQNIMREAEQERLPEPTDHELNKRLAQWAGVEIKEQACGPTNLSWYYWLVTDEDEWPEGEWAKWTPLTDANQMEEVEAWLREKFGEMLTIETHLYRDPEKHEWVNVATISIGLKSYKATDPDKKRAFALAILEMMKCDNIQKTELPVS